MSEIKPCPHCGEPLTVGSPEDWKPTFYDPDSGGDPYDASCVCGFSFCNGSYEYSDFVTAVNRRADGWIAVEERTPEYEVNVLIYTYAEQYEIAQLVWQGDGDEVWHAIDGVYGVDDIMCWQPLPSPPLTGANGKGE